MWDRIKLTVIISMLATVVFMQGNHSIRVTNAWWGTLYPEFCYSQIPEDASEDAKIRIEFRWLHGLSFGDKM